MFYMCYALYFKKKFYIYQNNYYILIDNNWTGLYNKTYILLN